MSKVLKVPQAMTSAFEAMLSEFGANRFRLNDLAERIYPLTRPRSRPVATELADKIFKAAAKAGTIQRTGHLHWMAVSQKRRLLSGREVPVVADLIDVKFSTHCPQKWLFLDVETGQAWVADNKGNLQAADKTILSEAAEILK